MQSKERIHLFTYLALMIAICFSCANSFAEVAHKESTKIYYGPEARQILSQWAAERRPNQWAAATNRIAYAQLQALAAERKVKSLKIVELPTDPQNVQPYTLLDVSVVLDEGCSLITLQAQIFLTDNVESNDKKRISLTLFREVSQEVICSTQPRMGSGN